MTARTRWIKGVTQDAKTLATALPWERGARRQAKLADRLSRSESTAKVTLPAMPPGVYLDASA